MIIKKSTMAMAAIAALALGASQPAMADVYAGSSLDISGLTIVVGGNTGTGLTGYTFNLANSATLNGLTTATSGTCNSLGSPACSAVSPVLTAPAANAPGSAPLRVDGAANNFLFFGPGSGLTYSNADSQINTAQTVQGVPTSTQQITEAELAGSGTAQANTNVQSNTTFTYTFAVAPGGGTFELDFFADPDLYVAVNTPGLRGALAQANTAASFSLQSSNGTNVQWNPDGNLGNAFTACTGATCAEDADSQSLTNALGLPGGNPSDNGISDARFGGVDSGLTAFGITIRGLQSGNYTLVLTGTTSLNVAQRVPEPGILGLLGIGLAGMLGVGRRRKQV